MRAAFDGSNPVAWKYPVIWRSSTQIKARRMFAKTSLTAGLTSCLAASFAVLLAAPDAQAQRGPRAAQVQGAGEPSRQTNPDAAGTGAQRRPDGSGPQAQTILPLPPDKTTQHKITIAGAELEFEATAGAIPLFSGPGSPPVAALAYIAFTRKTAEGAPPRPVTFAFNGGPGYASAWLNLGVMGPWRLDMSANGARPSAPPVTHANAESWLPFTDLVFIDPPGTGYGQIASDAARKQLWSVDGDIAALAGFIRRWSEQNNRMSAAKYVAGESYGGFRVPKVTQRLQTDEGVGVNGMILISPVLDFGRFRDTGVLSHVARLPSYAASAREKKGPVAREALADVEAYASGEFLLDLVAGPKDAAAQARLTEKVAQFAGLDRAFVARLGGRISAEAFAREIHRADGKVASAYDGAVMGLDPAPHAIDNEASDQMRLGLHAPIIQTMVDIYKNRLQWQPPNSRYFFQSRMAGRQWDWGRRAPEAVRDLAKTLALDPNLRVLVAHGAADLVTPYFQTKLTLDQMAPIGDPARLKFQVYPGGHMFYSRSASRQAFRDDARKMIAGE